MNLQALHAKRMHCGILRKLTSCAVSLIVHGNSGLASQSSCIPRRPSVNTLLSVRRVCGSPDPRSSAKLVNGQSFQPCSIARQLVHQYRMTTTATGSVEASAPKHSNRLAQEESPYLLQHAHNPVDWYPWGEEAFEKARREDKPIFLSVGYSTCHWCHVMERESFESEATAKLMNDWFVNVKVDREERPDVDKVYMTYVQATSGGGGWPMSVFLTPDLKPFLGATYFPPEDAYGRPGFPTVLRKVHEAWQSRKADIEQQSSEAMSELQAYTKSEGEQGTLGDSDAAKAMSACANMLEKRFDAKLGGFGGAPKFPRPAEISLLLHEFRRRQLRGDKGPETDKILHMALFTLQKMAAGGIYDHLGGGFHRYSVDEFWHVPHFEKMLYDNPQLVQTYLGAFAITADLQYAATARGVLDYMRRDLTHPGGGLHAAEDADSLNPQGEKSEGAFYVWSKAEIDSVLGEARAETFDPHYYVKPEGNCTLSPRSDPQGEFKGLNVLIDIKAIANVPKEAGMDQGKVIELVTEEQQSLPVAITLAESRRLLHGWRSKRPRPHLDDKVVAAWNGMAIGAYAIAARALAAETPHVPKLFPVDGIPARDYLDCAIKAAEFAKANLWDESAQRLRRSFCRGPSAVQGFADDYAYMVSGLLDLYSASGDVSWLGWALQLQDVMDELFWDDTTGGYFSTPVGDPSILLRMKEDYDGAEPAASSIAAANLFRLAGLTSPDKGQKYRDRALTTAAAFKDRLQDIPLAMPQMCAALYWAASSGPARQVIVAGALDAADTQTLLDAVHAPFTPDKAVVIIDTENEGNAAFWREHFPEALAVVEQAGFKPELGAKVFICQNFACQAPTSDPEKVREQLADAKVPKLTQLDPQAMARLKA